MVIFLFGLFLQACDKSKIDMTTETFYIKAGMSPNEYSELNRIYTNKSIDKQPAGLNFYEQDWGNESKGSVQIENEKFSFSINHVLSSTGVEDTEYLLNGIYKFSLNSTITSEEFINHDQARTQFMETLQNIVALGWQPYVEFYSEPRLLGRQSFQYALDDGSYSPDPFYTPTLDEWMELGLGTSWVFYANDTFLKIRFRRNSQNMEKEGMGVYLINTTIMTRSAHIRNYFEIEEFETWQNIWVEDIKKNKMMRYRSEVELIKQGYQINTQYVEPKLHPDDPVEPDSDEAKELLDYIQKHNK